ncbi:MAG: hypothetical protein AABY32_01290 [Nanoarchaeota archaeon]
MGITIHYKMKFTGTEKELTDKLGLVANYANELMFKDVKKNIYKFDFNTDINKIDSFTPTIIVKNEDLHKYAGAYLKPIMVDGKYVVIDEDYRWAKIQTQPWEDRRNENGVMVSSTVKGGNGICLDTWFGEGCEPTNFGFYRKGKGKIWKGKSFTKTQYAEEFVKAHISVCHLLKFAQKIGLVTKVSDEGDFYETNDMTKLVDNSEENLQLIAGMVDMFKKMDINFDGKGLEADRLLKNYQLKT